MKFKKICKAAAAVIAAVLILIIGSFVVMDRKTDNAIKSVAFEDMDTADKDVIYFLNTGSSDAIVLQSQGHYAMIDAGEDTDNPRGFSGLELQGYEQEVLKFLKETAADDNGIVHLDFVLGTHSHSDHIGGFDTIINDENVFIDRAYLKEYREENIVAHEIEDWDNQEVYNQMLEALSNKSVPVISDISSEPFTLGNFTLTILNTEYEDGSRKVGENDNSLVVLVEKGSQRALLTGDLDNLNKDEERIGELVGKVNLLKVGHHSYSHSTEKAFLTFVNPDASVVTNAYVNADKRTLKRISMYTDSSIMFSDDEGGIAAVFTDDRIVYANHKGL